MISQVKLYSMLALVLLCAWLWVQNAGLREQISDMIAAHEKEKRETAESNLAALRNQRAVFDTILNERDAKARAIEKRNASLLDKLRGLQGENERLSDYLRVYFNGVYERNALEFGGLPTDSRKSVTDSSISGLPTG